MKDLDAVEAALSVRPVPGTPRPFTFPLASRTRLSGGLSLVTVNLPGRPLISASLFLPNGAVDEPADEGGATVLAARALTEGTARRDAVALTEAAERLGASLRAEAGWDATVAGVDVPAERLGAALELLAELVREPAFPEREVERLRDQRLNDLLQAKVDPARRARRPSSRRSMRLGRRTRGSPVGELKPSRHSTLTRSGWPTSARASRPGRRSSSAAT